MESPLAPKPVIAEFPDRQAAIQSVIDTHTVRITALRLASAHARRDMFRLMVSPDYSPVKMRAALAAVATADAALEAESVAMAADSLSTLSPAQRQALAETLRKRNRSWLYRTFKPRGRM